MEKSYVHERIWIHGLGPANKKSHAQMASTVNFTKYLGMEYPQGYEINSHSPVCL